MRDERKFNIEDFDEYIRQGEPDKKEKPISGRRPLGCRRRCLRTSGRKATLAFFWQMM